MEPGASAATAARFRLKSRCKTWLLAGVAMVLAASCSCAFEPGVVGFAVSDGGALAVAVAPDEYETQNEWYWVAPVEAGLEVEPVSLADTTAFPTIDRIPASSSLTSNTLCDGDLCATTSPTRVSVRPGDGDRIIIWTSEDAPGEFFDLGAGCEDDGGRPLAAIWHPRPGSGEPELFVALSSGGLLRWTASEGASTHGVGVVQPLGRYSLVGPQMALLLPVVAIPFLLMATFIYAVFHATRGRHKEAPSFAPAGIAMASYVVVYAAIGLGVAYKAALGGEPIGFWAIGVSFVVHTVWLTWYYATHAKHIHDPNRPSAAQLGL